MTESLNWRIIGHERAVDALQRGLLHGRNRHAYLFVGSASLGKMTLARTFAMALNCENENLLRRPCRECPSCARIEKNIDPDLLFLRADDSGRLKIDAIRELTRLLSLKPYAARYRIAILDDFDSAQPQAQDALLKTLEEPAAHAVLILLARSTESILSTIRSRAQILTLRPLPMTQVRDSLLSRGANEERAQLLARLSNGRIGWALSALTDDAMLASRTEKLDLLQSALDGGRIARIKLAEEIGRGLGSDKPELRQTLELWQTYWRDVLLACYRTPVELCNSDRAEHIRGLAMRTDETAALKALQATRRTMRSLSTNANVRLALDVLFLEYPGLD